MSTSKSKERHNHFFIVNPLGRSHFIGYIAAYLMNLSNRFKFRHTCNNIKQCGIQRKPPFVALKCGVKNYLNNSHSSIKSSMNEQ